MLQTLSTLRSARSYPHGHDRIKHDRGGIDRDRAEKSRGRSTRPLRIDMRALRGGSCRSYRQRPGTPPLSRRRSLASVRRCIRSYERHAQLYPARAQVGTPLADHACGHGMGGVREHDPYALAATHNRRAILRRLPICRRRLARAASGPANLCPVQYHQHHYLFRYLRQQARHIGFMSPKKRLAKAARQLSSHSESRFEAGGFIWDLEDFFKNALVLGMPGSARR